MNSSQNSFNGSNMCKDCQDFINRLLDTMPLFIKFVVSSTIILYLLNFFIPYVALFLADIPYFTIYYCNIWRLITTPFMTTNILSIIFSLFFWFKEAVKLEKEIGTTKYMLIFLMNTLCIQIMYCLIMFLLSLIIRNTFLLKMKITQRGVVNEGLWPILLCDLTLLCLSNPEEPMKFFIFPCVIKAKYYPLILFLIFTIISGFNIDFEVMCGIGFGFLYHYYLRRRLQISNNFATKIENSFLCRWIKKKKGFINIGGIGIPQLQNNLENIRNVNISGNSDNDRGSKRGFTAFQGKGIAVGGDNTDKVTVDYSTNPNNNTNTTDYNNVSVGSSDDINSHESRLDLNSTSPKP